MIKTIIVCLLAGIAAGVGTGFSGLSATTVITPMLVSFLGCPWYESVGIGLASDVLASALSAVVYKKNDNVDLKHGTYMVVAVLIMTIVGSYFSQYMPDQEMGWFSIIMSLYMGCRFLFRARHTESMTPEIFIKTERRRKIMSILCGGWIGFYCGLAGAGGGMMMLLILTHILGYDVKMAVGTSVFVMTFTAFTGAASHFYFGDISNYLLTLALCFTFTTIAAVVSSRIANKLTAAMANKVTGITLIIIGIFMIIANLL